MRIEVTLCDTCRTEVEGGATYLNLTADHTPEGSESIVEFCSLACLRDFVFVLTTTEENA